jgi:hypothetical protein
MASKSKSSKIRNAAARLIEIENRQKEIEAESNRLYDEQESLDKAHDAAVDILAASQADNEAYVIGGRVVIGENVYDAVFLDKGN